MSTRYDRIVSLIGEDNIKRLSRSTVAVVGLGGVGGAAVEILARSGIGKLILIDGDEFDVTNLNRQVLCTERDIGRSKAVVAGERVKSVCGEISVVCVSEFVTERNVDALIGDDISYCIDAIDDVRGKVALITACKRKNIPVVSAMGAGNRLDCAFAVCDIYKTSCDPFARIMRRELKAAGVDALDTVCAQTPPLKKAQTPASVAAPPVVMGAMLANHAISRLIEL